MFLLNDVSPTDFLKCLEVSRIAFMQVTELPKHNFFVSFFPLLIWYFLLISEFQVVRMVLVLNLCLDS